MTEPTIHDVRLEVASLANRVSVIETEMKGVKEWVGESQEFHVEMRGNWNTFMGGLKAVEKVQQERHEANTTKLNLLMFMAAVIGLILTGIGIFVTVEVAHHAELDPAHFFHSQNAPLVYADSETPLQDAGRQ